MINFFSALLVLSTRKPMDFPNFFESLLIFFLFRRIFHYKQVHLT